MCSSPALELEYSFHINCHLTQAVPSVYSLHCPTGKINNKIVSDIAIGESVPDIMS